MKQLFHDDVLWCGQERNLVVCGWNNAPTGKHMDIVHQTVRGLGPKYPPTARALLNVIIRGRPSFGEDVRRKVREQYQSGEGARLAVANLVIATGLAGTAARAFLSAGVLLSRVTTATKIFGRTEDTAIWLTRELARGPEPWRVDDVLRVIHDARAICDLSFADNSSQRL